MSLEISEKLHEKAVEQKKDHYTDPKTGYLVFTSYYHLKRGHCCSSDCRHCPYQKGNDKRKSID